MKATIEPYDKLYRHSSIGMDVTDMSTPIPGSKFQSYAFSPPPAFKGAEKGDPFYEQASRFQVLTVHNYPLVVCYIHVRCFVTPQSFAPIADQQVNADVIRNRLRKHMIAFAYGVDIMPRPRFVFLLSWRHVHNVPSAACYSNK
jgi:hypothetical protein